MSSNLKRSHSQPNIEPGLPTSTSNLSYFPTSFKSLSWIDAIKAIAIIGIIWTHIADRLFGFPLIGYPTADWPPLSERISQLYPLTDLGLWTIPVNLFRYIGWSGNQLVQLFIILSGFGLTWGLLKRYSSKDTHTIRSAEPINWLGFYRRRLVRIYPQWWAVHLLFMGLWLLTGRGLSMDDPATYWSFLGIRFTSDLFYYFSPCWWFVGMILQFYLIYPILWQGLSRLGVRRFVGFTLLLGFAARAAGIYGMGDTMGIWLWGSVFITRLPDFAAGMVLAVWFFKYKKKWSRRFQSPLLILGAIASLCIGYGLALTYTGMVVAPFVIGISQFVLLYAFFTTVGPALPALVQVSLRFIGRHSYVIFLVHQTFVFQTLNQGDTGIKVLVGCVVIFVGTAIGSVVIEGGLQVLKTLWQTASRRLGSKKLKQLAAVGAAIAILGVAVTEATIRHVAPQEVLGWAERPSLSTHPTFGWHLTPNQTTRLRWQSYDYNITANSLGFPGPEYPEAKPSDTLRVMVTGDAFSSAEGVDTEDTWPRLLEQKLAENSAENVEVMNFGITGHGPNQYAAVIDEFAPRYKPDILLLEFFVNDFSDTLWTTEEFHESIGFHRPDHQGLFATLNPLHSQQLLKRRVIFPLMATLRGRPDPRAYAFGNIHTLKRDEGEAGKENVRQRLKEIKSVADGIDAQVAIAMVPASVQVCSPEALPYYSKSIDLNDDAQFDLDLPQRMAKQLAEEQGFVFYDLRDPLQSSPSCPYQPHNMHWLESGHEIVANDLAQHLTVDFN